MESVSGPRDWWIGLTDLGNEGDWRWQHSGKTAQFASWAKKTRGNTFANCATMSYGSFNYRWGSVGCGPRTNTYPICQLQPSTMATTPTIPYISTFRHTSPATYSTSPKLYTVTTETSTENTPPPSINNPTIKIYPETTVFSMKTLTLIMRQALDNTALPFVSISYTLQSNDSVQSATTNRKGRINLKFSTNSLPLILIYNATKEGFVPINGTIILDNTEIDDSLALSLTPVLKHKHQIRLVMNWGRLPKDLDLHALQFSNTDPGKSCETYFDQKIGCDGLYLEVDNTKGGEHGAETITWTDPGDNWYILYVFDYSGANTTLVQSEVRS